MKRTIYADYAASARPIPEIVRANASQTIRSYAPIHRGLYPQSQQSTQAYQQAKECIAQYMGTTAMHTILTKNATHALNIAAQLVSQKFTSQKKNIVISVFEHHANCVYWIEFAKKNQLELRVIPCTEQLELDYQKSRELIDEQTLVVALTHMSNVTGTIVELKELCTYAKRHSAYTIIDGTQAIVHTKVTVEAYGCDFYAWTGHKLAATTGIGVLYIARPHEFHPCEYGGHQVELVTPTQIIYKQPPEKFEPGTPPVRQALELAKVIDYFNQKKRINSRHKQTSACVKKMRQLLQTIPQVTLHSHVNSPSIVTCSIQGLHPHDVADILGKKGICVRAGHMCAQLIHQQIGIPATIRISFGYESVLSDCTAIYTAILDCMKLFKISNPQMSYTKKEYSEKSYNN
jgi:cysteine desulfurase / selenocysteine lyase